MHENTFNSIKRDKIVVSIRLKFVLSEFFFAFSENNIYYQYVRSKIGTNYLNDITFFTQN